jgi:hypothetical protein
MDSSESGQSPIGLNLTSKRVRSTRKIARALFHEYGISVDDMEPDFKVKVEWLEQEDRHRDFRAEFRAHA